MDNIEDQNITIDSGIVTIVPEQIPPIQIDVSNFSSQLDARETTINSNLDSLQIQLQNINDQITNNHDLLDKIAIQRAKLQ